MTFGLKTSCITGGNHRRFKNLMTRTGEPSIAELMAQLAANAAEIAALKAEKEALSQRVVKLQEELALAKLHRFSGPSARGGEGVCRDAVRAVGRACCTSA